MGLPGQCVDVMTRRADTLKGVTKDTADPVGQCRQDIVAQRVKTLQRVACDEFETVSREAEMPGLW